MTWIPEIPLLRRELTELANRRRTYLVRLAVPAAMLICVMVTYDQALADRMEMRTGFMAGPAQALGVGGLVFARIVPILFYGIQILMPALCYAAITSEKESNTIGTLLLTRLSPGTIIAEKFLSRVFPMLTMLLLTFPILAHVHTMGGVDTDLLIGTLWLLLCECLLFASIAILCSAWFATTVAAFTASYCLTGILTILSVSLELETFVPSGIWRSAFWLDSMYATPFRAASWIPLVMKSVPSLIATVACLVVARLVLVPRAFVSHASVVMRIFRFVDAFFKAINDRTTGGIEIIRDSNTLPDRDPVVWREQNKKSLGKARYLIRSLLFLEGPTLFVCLTAAILSARNGFLGLYVLQAVLWILVGLVASAKAATLFASERAKQTIEPLLATPMTATSMLDQKVAGMFRLLVVLSVPLLTVNFTQFLLHTNSDGLRTLNLTLVRPITYVFLCSFGTFVLLYLIVWTSASIGLRIHSQTKAVLASVAVLGLWTAVPVVVATTSVTDFGVKQFIASLSPLSVVSFSEAYLREPFVAAVADQRGNPVETHYLFWSVTSLLSYTTVVVLLRLSIRALSPRLLNRRENPSTIEPPQTMDFHRLPALEGHQQ